MKAFIEIDTSIIAKGSSEALALRRHLQAMKTDIDGVNKVNTQWVEGSKQAAISNRSLLFNFRMLSFAVRTLRREFGVTNPAIEAFSRTMIIGSAVGSLFVATNDLITRGFPALAGKAAEGKVGLDALNAGFVQGSLAVTGLAVGVGALIGLAFGTWIGEGISPVKQMNIAIRTYKEQIEELTGTLKELKAEQAGLNAESTMYAAAIARVNYEIQLQGYTTAAQTETLKMLEGALARASLASADLQAQTAVTTADQKKAAIELETTEKEKKEFRDIVFGEQTLMERLTPFSGQVHRQMARDVTGIPIEVVVDFTGAVFGDARDIVTNVRRGIDEGFAGVGRYLEQARRGRP